MKRYILPILLSLTTVVSLCAQQTADKPATSNHAYKTVEAFSAWNNDSIHLAVLDQEKLPGKVSGGVLFEGNFADFLITERGQKPVSSNMQIGLDFGGFMEFRIAKHFVIQGQALITAEQNRFAVSGGDTTNHLWSVGLEVPVYFMGRFGNMKKGYIHFGAGPYTHFTFAHNLGKKWTNIPDDFSSQDIKRGELESRYKDLYKLHSNYFGIAFLVGYEFPIGIQINFKYNISLSDIATFYNDNKGSQLADAALYPHKISLGIAYRIKPNKKLSMK